jgi:hypothetical protein
MKRVLRFVTVLALVVASLNVLPSVGFAGDHRIVSHRVNLYPGDRNPNRDPDYPPLGGSGGDPNPIKPHPIPVGGLPPAALRINVGKQLL